MPEGEKGWNPYNWVPVNNEPIARATPAYHHSLQGCAGRLRATLKALTPLLVGDGSGKFIARTVQGKSVPFIPGTSLKGAIRSLAELVGNAAAPFPHSKVDTKHQGSLASTGSGSGWQLDIAARTFGCLVGKVFAGLVLFSDAELVGELPRALCFKVAGGQPKPEHHAFYPHNDRRKFYHHRADATDLTPPHPGIKMDQQRTVYPLPPGTCFRFTVDFSNLREEELSLLLYCLVLEEHVEVKLGPEALTPADRSPVTLSGPMRHKLGSCKAQGAGSVHVRLDRIELRGNPTARYRGEGTAITVLDGDHLCAEVSRRIGSIVARMDTTMQHLRAMMIYTSEDRRARDLDYPTYAWFKAHPSTPLKPVL